MALDEAHRRLFVVGSQPARLIVLARTPVKSLLPATAELTDDMLSILE